MTFERGVDHARAGRDPEALRDLEAALPGLDFARRTHAEMLLGYLAVRRGDLDEAARRFEGVVREDAACLPAFTAFAHVLFLRGEAARAVTFYRLAVQMNPSSPVARHGLGYVLAETGGDLDEALYQCQEALRLAPASAAVRDSLGWVLYRHGDLSGAEEHLSEAMRLSPNDRAVVAHYKEVRARRSGRAAAVSAPLLAAARGATEARVIS